MSLMSLTAGIGSAPTGAEYGRVSVEFDRWDGPRAQYKWTVTTDAGVTESACDLRGPSDETIDFARELGALLTFLSAAAESLAYARASRYGDGENASLFPASLHEWIDAVGSDVFALAAIEVRNERH